MNDIAPCLWFDGQALEAAKYYCSVFKKGSKVTSVSYYPKDAPFPEGQVAFVEFTLRGRKFQALNGGPEFKHSEAVSYSIPCKDQKEVDYFWDRLIGDGGQASQCSWLKDKYGLSWQVHPVMLLKHMAGKDKAKAARVMKALWTMSKPIVADLEKAAKAK